MGSLSQNNRENKYRYFAFLLLSFIYLLVYFHRVSPAIMVAELKKEFAVSATDLGLFASLYFYMYAALQIPVGYLADSWGVRKAVALFTLIAGLGTLLFILAHSFGFILFSRVIIAIGVAGVYIPTLRFLTNWFNLSEFTVMTGVLLGIGNAGALMAATPLALSISTLGWRMTFLLISVISVLVAITVFLLIKDYPAKERERIKKKRYQVKLKQIKIIIFNKQMVLLCLAMFAKYGPTMGLQGLWGPKFFADIYHYQRVTAGNIFMALSLGYISGSLLVPVLATIIFKNKKKLLIIAAIIYLLAWTPFIIMPEITPFYWAIITFIIGFVGGGMGVLIFSLTRESFPRELAGVSISIVNNFAFAGAGIYQVIMGFILKNYQLAGGVYQATGYKWSFLTCLISTLVMLIVLSYIKETTGLDKSLANELSTEI